MTVRGKFVSAVTAGSVAMIAVGCHLTESKSRPRHETGKPTRSSHSIQWIVPNADVLEERLAIMQGGGEGDMLPSVPPADHVVNLRLQAWADRLDAGIRQRTGQALDAVPHPRVRVLGMPEANAFSFGFGRCLTVPVEVEGAAGPKVKVAQLLPSGSVIGTDNDNPKAFSCAKGSFSAPELGEVEGIVEYLNTIAPTGCSYQRKDGKVVIGNACLRRDETPFQAAEALNFQSTGNVIAVFSGMIASVRSEQELLAILAHELGHFYRSHTNYDRRYFYKHSANPQAGVPLPDPELTEKFRDVAELSDTLRYEDIPGSNWPTAMFGGLLNLPVDTNGPFASAECVSFASEMERLRGVDKPLGWFPYTPLPESGQAAYFQILGSFEECARSLPLSSAEVKNFAWDGFGGGISPSYLDKEEAAPKLDALLNHQSSTLLDAAVVVGEMVATKARQWDARVKEVVDARLGFYTVEQEADEIMAEILDAESIGVEYGINVWMGFAAGNSRVAVDEVEKERCLKYIASDFLDAQGQEIFVIPGIWKDDHHSTCYRAYNVSRERRAHGYRNPGRPLPGNLPGGDFETNIKALAAEMKPIFPNAGGGERGAVPRRHGDAHNPLAFTDSFPGQKRDPSRNLH